MQKRDLITQYGLPAPVRFCRKCTMSNQRPRIGFDENGVCSACNFAEFKKSKIDWQQRQRELVDLCNKYRRNDGSHDVIVPCSGGKDGSFVAHQLKYEYGMNPLTVTWAPLRQTELGRRNLTAFIQSGFDNILGTPNGLVTRKLTELSFRHIGDPFQPFIYGQTNFPLQISVSHGIPLIMYGENGEVEYGGDMKNAFRPDRDIQDHDKHYFSGLPPEFWASHGVSLNDLKPFMAPSYADIVRNQTAIHFLGYYTAWDPLENFHYASKHMGFSPRDSRNEGTYSNYASLDDAFDGFHYYLGFIKFGIGRTTSDTAHEIRDGAISRNHGIDLVRKYDGEFPAKYFAEFLDYCSINEDDFWEVVDSWRSDHIWTKSGNNWSLKHPVWQENN